MDKEIRRLLLEAIYHAGSGHPGGSLSCVEILVWLYFHQMGKDDTFILSKGHAAPALYAAWVAMGKYEKSELMGLRKLGSSAQGHPSFLHTPDCVASTGSLGQGLSTAVGIALGKKRTGQPGQIYVLIGDGEMQEGIVWECLIIASHHKLTNLTVILDYNKMQSDALNSEISELEPLAEKVRSFGFAPILVNGHDLDEFEAVNVAQLWEAPKFVIAHTVKGQGVSYMANDPAWHGSVTLTAGQLDQALKELA